MASVLQDRLRELSDQARSVTVDGQQVNRRSLEEIIAADRYLTQLEARQTAQLGGGLGIKFVKLIPPGGG